MKILYIITTGGLGGAQKYVLELAKYFQGTIAVGIEHTELQAAAKKNNIAITNLKFMKRSINPIWDLLAFFELLWVIINSDAEIIHSNSTKAGILGSIAGKLVGKKTVFTIHGFSLVENNQGLTKLLYTLLEKFSSIFRDRIITVSDYDKQLAMKHKITRPEKITTIYNGIDGVDFLNRDVAKSELKVGQNKLIIGTIARLQHLKGVDILVKSISLLPDELKQKILVIVIGDGPDYYKISQRIQSLNLSGIVKLIGSKTEASKFISAFEVYISPSRYEGMPFALIEALHSTVPIIATKVGGTEELLKDGAILTESNSESICKAISSLINNRALQANLVLNANKRARLFTKKAMLEKTESLYKSL